MSARLDGWDARLALWARERIGMDFAWGERDCSMLCMEAYDILTGGAEADRYRGGYASATQALRLTREGVHLETVLRALGASPIEPGFQQRGDFLLHDGDGYVIGHVCFGLRSLSARPDTGVCWVDTAQVLDQPGARVLGVR